MTIHPDEAALQAGGTGRRPWRGRRTTGYGVTWNMCRPSSVDRGAGWNGTRVAQGLGSGAVGDRSHNILELAWVAILSPPFLRPRRTWA